MKSITIKGTKRVGHSKSETKKLRADGKVPCVLYGGKDNVHFEAPALDFRHLVYTPNVYVVALDVDGQQYNAVMREIQFHPVTDRIQHIDFQQVFDNKPVVMGIPVKLKGTAEGVREGGKLIQKLRKLQVKALPAQLPDDIEIDISPLAIGSSVRVGDISREGVTFLDSKNNIIVGVRVTRAVVEEAPVAAAAAAPAAGVEGAAAPAAAGAAPAAGAKPADAKAKPTK